jgi:hypothetical protein
LDKGWRIEWPLLPDSKKSTLNILDPAGHVILAIPIEGADYTLADAKMESLGIDSALCFVRIETSMGDGSLRVSDPVPFPPSAGSQVP